MDGQVLVALLRIVFFMTRYRSLVLAVCALGTSACTTPQSLEYVGESSYLIKETVPAEGVDVTYRLRVRSADSAALVVQTERDEPFAKVGLEVAELDRERARDLGDHALSGLLVKAVEAGSPAAGAGIEAGEVLVRVGGQRVVFLEAFGTAVAGLPAGESSDFELRKSGDPDGDLRTVKVVPAMDTRRRSKIEDVPLVSPKTKNPVVYMGVSVRAFPPAYTQSVFGHSRPVSVITGVGLGSPAYRAGLRAGDVILAIDGVEAPGPEGLMALLRKKGPRSEALDVKVRSQYGEFEARVELADYSGSTRTFMPLTWLTEVSAKRTRWNAVLGGWLAGYDNSYLQTRTRQTAERGHFTAMMGLFRRDWSPSGSSTRLLWFFKIEN